MFDTETCSQPIPNVLLAAVDIFTDEFCSPSSEAISDPKIFVTYCFIPNYLNT